MSAITLANGATQTTQDASAVVTLNPAPAAGTVLRFSLTVTDDLGQTSQPAFVDVTVQAVPVAVISSSPTVATGGTINLDGSKSSPAGNLKDFNWQLVNETTATGAPTGTTGGTVITNPGNPILKNPILTNPILKNPS